MMRRFMLFMGVVISCESFLVSHVHVRYPQRVLQVHTRRPGEVDESLIFIKSPASNKSPSQLSRTRGGTPSDPNESAGKIDRRSLLKVVPSTLAAGIVGLLAASEQAASARVIPRAAKVGEKVVVIGGSGFVGSRVCEMLVEAGDVLWA